MSTRRSLKRSSSQGRLAAEDELADDYRYRMAVEKMRCDLVGFPYCCNKHYSVYRRPPYYADLDYPYYSRWYDRSLYWPECPLYHRQPWYYDEYYRDYARGYEEGLKKYETKLRRSASSTELAQPDEAKDQPGKTSSSSTAAAAAAAAEDESALRGSPPPPPPPPPPLLSRPRPLPPSSVVPPYYDSYYAPYHSWYRYPYDYYHRPYYWRRYLDSRAY